MLPLQLLFLNMIYDISCISIPWDHMDKEYLDEPKSWISANIGKFMLWIGPTSSVFDITTYLLMYFVICPAMLGGSYHTLSPAQQATFIAIFHAGWFVESLWTQTMVLHCVADSESAVFAKSGLIQYDCYYHFRNRCRNNRAVH